MSFELKLTEGTDPRAFSWKHIALLVVAGLGAVAEQLKRIADKETDR